MDSDFGVFSGKSVVCWSRVEIVEGENMHVEDSTDKVWIVVERSGISFNCLVEL